jgi:hypothetical protein
MGLASGAGDHFAGVGGAAVTSVANAGLTWASIGVFLDHYVFPRGG